MINLCTDGTFETYDLRYRELVGKKVRQKIRFALYQIMPTNVYDAVSQSLKVVGVVALIAAIMVIVNLFF